MKYGSFVFEPEDIGGYSGHAIKHMIKPVHRRAVFVGWAAMDKPYTTGTIGAASIMSEVKKTNQVFD